MNESGPALERVRSFLKLEAAEVLLIHDDIDLPLDTVRISFDASAGGHNGVRSVITALGTSTFCRLRIGIETRTNKSEPPADAFVLQPFLESEQQRAVQKGCAALTAILTTGATTAMNTYNTRSNG
jgi:PTH1 family peptidyl-tRNA hydrolase